MDPCEPKGNRSESRTAILRHLLAGSILFLATSALAGGKTAQAPETPDRTAPKLPVWQEVSYSASKFLLRASTTMRVDLVQAEELQSRLREPPDGKGVPLPDTRVLHLSATTDMPFGRSEESETWLDPTTGGAVLAEKISHRRRPYRKVYRYTDKGIYVWRTAPADAREQAGHPEKWSDKETELETLDRPLPENAALTDAYSLLVLLSLHPFQRQEETHTHFVLADGRLVELTFTAGGLTTAEVDFDETRGRSNRRRAERIVVRPVTVAGRAVADPDNNREVDLGFLGMRGSLTVLLEAETGIPIEVSGRVERIGHLVVRLTQAVLRDR